MSKKILRIIIADKKHENRLCIEKQLNSLGYFRIITTASFAEASRLAQVENFQVGLVIIEESLIHTEHFNQLRTQSATPNILVYRTQMFTTWDQTLIGLPDIEALRTVMSNF
ncbi:hypothetical protein KO533_18575 [Shewanella sp. NKUCC05_KAH]|uniref:hypothetical protein n=1 Tax=Shewanella TaxID=22 RepID=UPI001BAF10F8|nr:MULTISPECIES: hypothetical protein [unclassified Shewanella]MBS0045152.1 hypothetical protein [Shewanella sp. M16]MBW3528559.1 hypothetical protein [Shewanella sp. NKUCC05_KAH]MCU8032429.1 hypothetical protein [Shewanella sp. SM73]